MEIEKQKEALKTTPRKFLSLRYLSLNTRNIILRRVTSRYDRPSYILLKDKLKNWRYIFFFFLRDKIDWNATALRFENERSKLLDINFLRAKSRERSELQLATTFLGSCLRSKRHTLTRERIDFQACCE